MKTEYAAMLTGMVVGWMSDTGHGVQDAPALGGELGAQLARMAAQKMGELKAKIARRGI